MHDCDVAFSYFDDVSSLLFPIIRRWYIWLNGYYDLST
jgi:hypothetical protein